MSVSASSRVWKQSKQEDSALVLMLALADWGDDDGISWYRVEAIAKKIRKKERQTQRLINAVRDSGELYVHRGQGRGVSSVYFVTTGLTEDEIKAILKERLELPDLLALQEAKSIFEKQSKPQEKGVMDDALSLDKKVTSNDTISQKKKVSSRVKKGVIQGQKKVSSDDATQEAIPLVAVAVNGQKSETTYVIDPSVDPSDSKVVSVDTTLQPSSISDLEKPIEKPIEQPEEKSEPEKASEPITPPSEERIPESPPSSEAPPLTIQQRYVALIYAWHNAIPEAYRPIGDPPIERNLRVAKQLHAAGITPEDVTAFVTDKHPGYSKWAADKKLPAVMPFEFVQRYIRAWLNQRDGKAAKFKTSQQEADEFLENWCEDCNRPLMYCTCQQVVKAKFSDTLVLSCWNAAVQQLALIIPKSARKRLQEISPIDRRDGAIVLEVHNPAFRDELALTLASSQFTDLIRDLSKGALTKFQVNAA